MNGMLENDISVKLHEWAKTGRLTIECHYINESEHMTFIRLDNKLIYVVKYDEEGDEHVTYVTDTVSQYGQLYDAYEEFEGECSEELSDEIRDIMNVCSYFVTNGDSINGSFINAWIDFFHSETSIDCVCSETADGSIQIEYVSDDDKHTIEVLDKPNTYHISEEEFKQIFTKKE